MLSLFSNAAAAARRASLPLFFFLLTLFAAPVTAQEAAPPDKPILRIETGMHTATIRSISVDGANRYLVTASEDKTARVWEAQTGVLLNILRPPIGDGDEGKLYAVAISPDGGTVACGGYVGFQWDKSDCLYLFDRATGTLRQRVIGLPNVVQHMAYSPDGRFLVATLGSGGIRLYRTADYTLAGQDSDYSDQSYGAAFGLVGGTFRMVISCFDGFIRLYDVNGTSGALHLRARSKPPGGSQPCGVAFSPEGAKIAVGFNDSAKVAVLSADDLSSLYAPDTADMSNGNLANVCWSSDGGSLYAAGSYGLTNKDFIRKWIEGKGAHTKIAAAGDTICGLQPRQAGGVFFGAGDPAWGTIDTQDRATTLGSAAIADFRDNQNGFRLAADSSAVAFGYQPFGKSPAVFSLTDRKLTLGGDGAGTSAPVTTAEGLDVQEWESTTKPTLNTQPLKLEPYEMARSLAIAPDHAAFLLGTSGPLHLFGKDGTQKWQVPTPGETWTVNISGDGKTAVAAFADGTIRWYRMTDGQELLAFFPHADQKRWVLWTPSGYYDCSPGGEDLIGWHVNHGRDQAADFFPASRFRDTYYRPDVVAKILTTQDEAGALAQANADAGRKAQVADIQKTLPPVVSILSPDSGATVSTDTVTLKYSLRTPSGEPVTGLKVLVDGRPVSAPRKLVLVAADTSTAGGLVREETVTVPHQDCTVSVIAENQYAASEAATVRLVWKGAAPAPAFVIKPTLYVLAVGISKYDNPEFALTYPAKDARDFAAALQKQKGQLYADVVVKVLTDGDATKDGITDGLDWIERQTTQHDVAMVFLSGHGANDRNGNYLFIPANFSRDHVKTTGLAFSDIKGTVQNLAGKTLFFVDSCHSGNVMGTAKSRAVDITGAVNELSSAENGAIVFAASTGNQVALEDPAWGNGAFTKALVEAISGQADYNHDGKITVNMLDLYISKRVKDLTHGDQTPTTTKPETVPDFPVAVRL